ncbi:ead/Ea22-like family protein [Citrobacter sp. Awk 2]|uniref:ead/Ea22-like family protein n=1 Tax=Citrobacter sp. Awk 2 TaxID=2963959 RepID=UPI0023025D28|nr:ead/Ea22-like family protein [Citrobacter sp. Awk 2]MDA8502900.1 ead/Ea22-like family protein [Citrobacter sp. Awk 2]
MNDITMLLQRMKSAASLATQGEWSYARSGFNSIVQVSVSLLRGGPARAVLCKLFRSEWRSELNTAHDAAFIALANPANVMTLVGALEARDKLIVDSESRVRQQNRHVCELFDENAVLRQRIAELESKLANPVLLPKTNGYWTEQEKAYEEAITLAKRQIRLAGFQVIEGEQQ